MVTIGKVDEARTQPFVENVPVKLKVNRFGYDLFGNEAGIEVTWKDGSTHGVVPARVFDEKEKVAYGIATGTQGGMIWVMFPPTQGGRATLLVPEDVLEKIE